MKVRPTLLLTYETCPRLYQYRYMLGIEVLARSANLAFGTVSHKTATDALSEMVLEGQPMDPDRQEQAFLAGWEQRTRAEALQYSSTLGPEMAPRVGAALARQFAERWPQWGIEILLDAEGNPIVEQRLEADLGGGLILSSTPDTLVMTENGAVMPLDIKTASSPCADWFPEASDQLTAQQIVIEANRDRLMIQQVDRVGFLEMIKKSIPQRRTSDNGGPQVLAPKMGLRRSPRRVREYVQKVHWLAEDIAAGKFPARAKAAYDTPCDLCDYRGLCLHDDMTGLCMPEAPKASRAAA